MEPTAEDIAARLLDSIVWVPGDEETTIGILDIDVVSTSNAAIATVTAIVQGETITASGDSRRYLDKPNTEIGELLAAGRAIEKLGRKIMKRANGLVAQADHNAKIKPEQQLRRLNWETSNERNPVRKQTTLQSSYGRASANR